MSDILNGIITTKHGKKSPPLRRQTACPGQKAKLVAQVAPRDFVGAIRNKIAASQPAVIAEIKRPAPPRGRHSQFQTTRHRPQLRAQHGAACLSGADRPPVFPGLPGISPASPRRLRLAGAAQKISWSMPPGRRSTGDGCRLHPAHRRCLSLPDVQALEAQTMGFSIAVLVESAQRRRTRTRLQLKTRCSASTTATCAPSTSRSTPRSACCRASRTTASWSPKRHPQAGRRRIDARQQGLLPS